ncbi:MAG: hypothetical protein AMXMBFR78_05320 [Rubrivivax sp.]
MSEPLPEIQGATASDGGAAATATSAGALLRAAREREGLHLGVLAATIKVAPAKLQALEQDRYDELPNATFTRALAQSVCRSLKIDPRPVLALLPQADAAALDGTVGRLNEPFRERGARGEGAGLTRVSKPMFWAGGLLLLAALVVGLVPSSLLERVTAPSAPPSAASAVAAGASAVAAPGVTPGATPGATPGVVPDHPPLAQADAGDASAAALSIAASPSAPQAAQAAQAASAATTPEAAASVPLAPAAGLLTVRATAPSWIEIVDAEDRVLLSRVVGAGESVQLDGRPPLRVRIGNAEATALFLRGQPVDLAPHTRVNVARLELR